MPGLRTLLREIRRRDGRVWIVGGALRDLLLGQPVREWDVAATTDPERLADMMEAEGLGKKVVLSEASPRVVRVAGARDIDIAELTGGSIEADLARRDFTVNAIAWEPATRTLIDPYRAIADLTSRRLRLISENNLREDPLRILRAARLMATRGLQPDRRVTAACRLFARRIGSTAPERVRGELLKILESSRAFSALAWLGSVGALAPSLGWEARRFPAGRFAHGLSRLDAWAVRRAGPTSRRIMRLCLLAAGLGLSPREAARWLARRRFSNAEALGVAELLDLVNRVARERTEDEQWQWVRDSGPRRGDALVLARLLLPGLQTRIRRLARRRPARPVRVSGSDVMRWLDISPGPAVGALLRDVEIQGLRGVIRTRPQARKWLRGTRA